MRVIELVNRTDRTIESHDRYAVVVQLRRAHYSNFPSLAALLVVKALDALAASVTLTSNRLNREMILHNPRNVFL